MRTGMGILQSLQQWNSVECILADTCVFIYAIYKLQPLVPTTEAHKVSPACDICELAILFNFMLSIYLKYEFSKTCTNMLDI